MSNDLISRQAAIDADLCFDALDAIESCIQRDLKRIKVGDAVLLLGERIPYRVQCAGGRYVICTKPFNLKHTVQYFIIDKEKEVRGPDDRVFCMGYETKEQCQERLNELENGEIEVSARRCLPIHDFYRMEGYWELV